MIFCRNSRFEFFLEITLAKNSEIFTQYLCYNSAYCVKNFRFFRQDLGVNKLFFKFLEIQGVRGVNNEIFKKFQRIRISHIEKPPRAKFWDDSE